MTTLKDVLIVIQTLPVEAFHNFDTVHEVIEGVRARRSQWTQSDDANLRQQQADEKLTRRQDRDTAFAKRRNKWAREHVKAGMFIKVTGARDGYGVREVISVEMDGVACRQWLPNGRPRHSNRDGFSKTLWRAENQMTTHMFDKVTGVFTPYDVAGQFILQKIK